MAPAASRLVGTGLALGLAATTFVAPGNNPHHGAALRGVNVDTNTTASTSQNGHLASLAVASVSLAAVGAATSRSRVQAKSAAQAAEPATPPPFQPSEQFGATEPLGFFDPLGFTAVGDERGFRKLRVSEIKHGRVAMMASIGLVGQHFLKFPGFENSPAGFSLMGKGEGVLGFFAIFLVSGFLELAWREDPAGEREPGNYGDPFGVQMYNDEMRMKELNNGRMAMISVLGIFAAELATGKDAIEQFGL